MASVNTTINMMTMSFISHFLLIHVRRDTNLSGLTKIKWWYFRVKVLCEGYYMSRQQVDALVSH